MKYKNFLAFLSFAVISCGGGSDGTSTTPPTPIISVSISPATTKIFDGTTTQFSATVTGSTNTAVIWSVADGAGVVSADGLYTAPSMSGTFELKAASVADPAKFATAKIEVVKISITAGQRSISLAAKQAVQLNATVSGDSNKDVKWSIKESSGAGEISQTGLYRAPSALGNFQVIASSVADPRKFITFDISVNKEQPDTSYLNYKAVGLSPKTLPDRQDARAFIDLNNDGILDFVSAAITYWGKPLSESKPADLKVWLGTSNGEWIAASNILPSTLDCLHPRKIAIADYNQDGKKDMFFACHGYDAEPFPGEKNIVILSSANGFVMSPANNDVGFFHSATSADVDFDGYPDVVIVNNFDSRAAVSILLNNKDGTFSKNYAMAPSNIGSKNYFSAELVDIDDDQFLDLIR